MANERFLDGETLRLGKSLDGCCQVRVRRQVAVPDRNQAWECAEFVDSEVSEVVTCSREATNVDLSVEAAAGMLPLDEVEQRWAE